MSRCRLWLAAQAGIGQVKSNDVDVASKPWQFHRIKECFCCLVAFLDLVKITTTKKRGWKSIVIARLFCCCLHLQLLIFGLYRFVRVDPGDDRLQPLLLLPRERIIIMVMIMIMMK